jgi:hypothetical protein
MTISTQKKKLEGVVIEKKLFAGGGGGGDDGDDGDRVFYVW